MLHVRAGTFRQSPGNFAGIGAEYTQIRHRPQRARVSSAAPARSVLYNTDIGSGVCLTLPILDFEQVFKGDVLMAISHAVRDASAVVATSEANAGFGDGATPPPILLRRQACVRHRRQRDRSRSPFSRVSDHKPVRGPDRRPSRTLQATRVGRGGKTIHVLKFRTMVKNADSMLAENPDLRRAYEENFKLKARSPRHEVREDPA